MAVRHPELHEGTRLEGARDDDLMPPGRSGLVQLVTGSAHGFDAGTFQLQQNADVAMGDRRCQLHGQEARIRLDGGRPHHRTVGA